MSAARTAQIIRFPSRQMAEISQPSRLSTAMTTLDVALAEQRSAVAAWRESLTELRQAVSGLGQGLAQYNARLDLLSADVATLNNDARAMEDWADTVLAVRVAPRR